MLNDYFSGDFKIVRDSVHGYIRIPSCYMREIVDSNLFQRLRHIEQTSMRPLFPAARHDRFIHSLGVFHLGCKVFSSVQRGAKADGITDALPECDDTWWEKHHLLFTLACLLHDCAHAAFSHTYEVYYEIQKVETSSVASELLGDDGFDIDSLPEQLCRLDVEMLREYAGDERFSRDYLGENANIPGAPHERMSALMVRRYFHDRIVRIFDELNRHRAVARLKPITLEDDDFALMARMIIGCPFQHDLEPVLELKNCFISLLNSSTVDVDGLDYMMRDTHNSGISNRNVDYDRLLDSIRICEATRFVDAQVKDADVEGVWLQDSAFSLDGANGYSADATFTGQLNCKFNDSDDCSSVASRLGQSAHPKTMACSIADDDKPLDLRHMRAGYEVFLTGSCFVKLKSWSGCLNGVVCKPKSQLGDSGSCEQARVSFVLVYGKASISVLQAAVDARNTFYQWVYAHPQIVYHANFLQNYLLKMSAKYLCCMRYDTGGFASGSPEGDGLQECGDNGSAKNAVAGPLPPRNCRGGCPLPAGEEPLGEEDAIAEILGLEGFYRPDDDDPHAVERDGFRFWRSSDDDLNSLFKWVYLHNKTRGSNMSKDIDEFFGEYFSRPHHHAVWKSYGERKLIRRKYPSMAIPEFGNISGAERSLSSGNYVFIEEGSDCLTDLRHDGHRSLIAINAKMSLKSLNYARLLVLYPDGVERLVDMIDSSTSFKTPEPMMYVFSIADASDGAADGC